MKPRIIVCGLDRTGYKIFRLLRQQGAHVVSFHDQPISGEADIIVGDLQAAATLRSAGIQSAQTLVLAGADDTVRSLGIPVIQGDASLPATLQAGNLDSSAALLSVTSDDIANLEIALNAKGLTPSVSVIVRYEDPDFARMAQQVFEFEAVLCPTELVAPAFAAAALGGRILGNGMTADSLWVALATLITPAHPFCGQPVREVAMTADFVPLYLETNCQTIHSWDLLNTCLSAGDILYLTIPATELEQLWRTTPSQLIVS